MPLRLAPAPTDVSARFTAAVRAIRLDRGLTARRLADLISDAGYPMSRDLVARQETGAPLHISLDQADATARALRLPLAGLLAPVTCGACHDAPPRGFTCNTCGRTSVPTHIEGA